MKDYRSGKYVDQGFYKSFEPEIINKNWQLENMEVLKLLSQADRHLGRLDMFSQYIPNLDLFIKMHVAKEATQSSKIEGTQTNIDEALTDRQEIAIERRDDWEEVHNYIKAMNHGIARLNKLPFSSRLIKETHDILLQSVRGKHRQPGEFRQTQNWIGGATLNDAVFIPPVHTSIPVLMSDLEKFAHNEESHFPELLKIALIHYQFETIHPFLDGNGRIGRLFITLYLISKTILKQPILYLSDFFEKNRTIYYDNLMRVRDKNDITTWFKFFLTGVIETAKKSVDTFDEILKLKNSVESKIETLRSRSAKARILVHYMYEQPIVEPATMSKVCNLSMASAYKLAADLERLEVIRETTGAKRGRIYVFEDYLKLFR